MEGARGITGLLSSMEHNANLCIYFSQTRQDNDRTILN